MHRLVRNALKPFLGARGLSACGPAMTLWPAPCPVCAQWTATGLCKACQILLAPRRQACQRCAMALAPATPLTPSSTPSSSSRICGRCLTSPPPVCRSIAALDYSFPWPTLVGAWKFRQRLDLSPMLARQLYLALNAADNPQPSAIDLICAVPLSRGRLHQRGYNQTWELARRLGRWLDRPATPSLLQRCRETAAQSGLRAAERLSNVRGAFAVSQPCNCLGRRIALVDDVMTTGATAFEAARTLRAAGAAEVELWVLARTPEPDLPAA